MRKGSAIITAIGMGIVLMVIIAAVHTFSSYRMQTTIQESRRVKALALAEAGLELAIGELFNNSGFVTHKLSNDFKWLGAEARKTTLKDVPAHGFKIDASNSGTICGALGDGKFRVKVGWIPYKDDPKTKNLDESLSYVRIESLGIYDTTVRRVDAVINRRFPAREFLMYDGGFLSMVFGQTNKSNKNVFSTGHLYGHKGIEIGRILMSKHVPATPGTTQELDDMNAIISGAGGIFIYSPIKAKFRERRGVNALTTELPTNTTFPTNGTYDNPADIPYGAYPKEIEGTTPAFPDNLKPWIKDKHSGMSIPPREPPFEQYKAEAKSGKGLYIAANDGSAVSVKYRMPSGWTKNGANSLDVAYLDFGSNIRESKVNVPENGVIYSEKDIVIKGNPPKDVSIVSAQNVFVAGDFNQRGDRTTVDGYYGFPQDYDSLKNALTANDYSETVKALFRDDVNKTAFKNHVAATVVARERIVYDYRSPVDCFENEIFPFMKYKLAEKISDESTAASNCLERNQSGVIEAKATVEEFEADLDSYFNEFPINDAAQNSLKTDLKQAYEDNSGKFDFKKFDDACLKVWGAYAKNYESDTAGERGAVSTDARTTTYGVYQLLNKLRGKMGITDPNSDVEPDAVTDKAGDYLFFPEMTTNAMFISCGEQNNVFYAGPDVQKYYNKIGLNGSKDYGINHSKTTHFLHRVYGSEMNMRLVPVHRITNHNYTPPTRRKIYDETLPKLGLAESKFELAGFIVISWKDTMATPEEFESF